MDITHTAVWASSKPSVAKVTHGAVTTLKAGTTSITATFGSISGISRVTSTAKVILTSITITPNNSTLPKGAKVQMTATGQYSNGSTQNLTNQVSWDVTNDTIATISNDPSSKGLVASQTTGAILVSATFEEVSNNSLLTITPATIASIEIEPANATIAFGTEIQFEAIATYTDGTIADVTDLVTWQSSDESAATIENTSEKEGLALGLAGGSTTIGAYFTDEVFGQTTLNVTDAELVSIKVISEFDSLAKGNSQPYSALGIYDDDSMYDITNLVAWSSENETLATIGNENHNRGFLTSLEEGTLEVYATLGMITGIADLKITAPELVSFTVVPENATIKNGMFLQMSAIGTLTDGSTMDATEFVNWGTENDGIATISNEIETKALATSSGPGTTVIRAERGGIIGETNLTVSTVTLTSIEIIPANPSIAAGTSQQFTAIAHFDDDSIEDVTAIVIWESADESIATISNDLETFGFAKSHLMGSSPISARIGDIIGETELTVTDAELIALVISPIDPFIAMGLTQQFIAWGEFSDETFQDITKEVTWKSTDESKAIFGESFATKGRVTTLEVGETFIRAIADAFDDQILLTITEPELVSIAITPPNATIDPSDSQQYVATGTYTDGSSFDITDLVTWNSSQTGVASISNAAGSEGFATAMGNGSTTITATLGDISNTTSLSVAVEVLLDYVIITPTTPNTLKRNNNRQLTGRAYYTDGSNQNVTGNKDRWTTSNGGVIKMNHANTPGQVRAVNNSGTSTITFTYTEGSITRQATINITAVP